jgi:Protein of unknown function (DUF3309)
MAPIPDRDLCRFGESLQQPGQCHFQPDMVVRHIEVTRCRLPERTDSEDHAAFFPSFLIDLQHRDAGSGTGQPGLETAGCFFPAKAVRNRNDEGCRHLWIPLSTSLHLVPHFRKNRARHWQAGLPERGNFPNSDLFPRPKAEQLVPAAGLEEKFMSLGTIILIILVIALLGGFSGIGGGPFYGTGYYGGGGLGLVIVILLILLLLGRL